MTMQGYKDDEKNTRRPRRAHFIHSILSSNELNHIGF